MVTTEILQEQGLIGPSKTSRREDRSREIEINRRIARIPLLNLCYRLGVTIRDRWFEI